ncbi:organic cation transporter protein-like [Anneissia japonica]|uniref:organic cation transporter protein-like n=1 Tax=Anneissia japonica TaxID=1529436 RepID=UPI0014258609|nr:organic cation transporter protein-like [Anneissia japonica]
MVTMTFDDVLIDHVGEFGKAQRIYFFLVCLTAIPCAYHSFANTFLSGSPKHHCSLEEALKYGASDSMECAIPWDEKNGEWSKCTEYKSHNVSEDLKNCTHFGKDGLTECRSGWIYDNEIYGDTVVTDWNLVCDKNWMRQLGKSIVLLGKLIGSFVFGQLSDKFGRKKILMIALIIQVVSGVASSLSKSFPVFIVFQFLVGSTCSGVFITAFVFVTEMVGPSWRTFIGITIEYFYTFGYIILAGVAYALRDWKNIELALSLPSILLFSYYWLIPESPRWMIAKGRYDEGMKVLKKIAKINNSTFPENGIQNILNDKENNEVESETAKELFITPTMRKKTFLISFNWLTNSMVYYGLSFHTESLGTNPYFSFFIAGAVEVPAYILSQLLLNRLGRKKLLCIFMVIGGLVLLSTTVIKDYKIPVLICAMIGKLCITASYGIIYLYSAELYPTSVRNVGLGFSSVCARIGGVSAPYILLIGDTTLVVMPLILFGAQSLLAGVLILLLPDTLNKKLPDTVSEADKHKIVRCKHLCGDSRPKDHYRSVNVDDSAV